MSNNKSIFKDEFDWNGFHFKWKNIDNYHGLWKADKYSSFTIWPARDNMFVAYLPVGVPAPSGCLGSASGEGDSPINAINDAIKNAIRNISKVRDEIKRFECWCKKHKLEEKI